MIYIIIIVCYLGDIITKKIALTYIGNAKIDIIGDFIYLQILVNTGIAFSIPLNGIILKFITIILILAIFVYYTKREKKNLGNALGYGFLIGGALGNAHERIINSGVTDFIGIKYFAVFNLADTFICMGIFILLLQNYAKPSSATK